MTRDEVASDLIEQAKKNWAAYWDALADNQRLRLSGMEQELEAVLQQLFNEFFIRFGPSCQTASCAYNQLEIGRE